LFLDGREFVRRDLGNAHHLTLRQTRLQHIQYHLLPPLLSPFRSCRVHNIGEVAIVFEAGFVGDAFFGFKPGDVGVFEQAGKNALLQTRGLLLQMMQMTKQKEPFVLQGLKLVSPYVRIDVL
jgi:hypothetical protein